MSLATLNAVALLEENSVNGSPSPASPESPGSAFTPYSHPQRRLRPRIERVDRIASPGDRMIERVARLLILPLIFVEFAQFFVICHRGIVQNICFDLFYARPSSKPLKHVTKKPQVRQHFRHDIHTRPQEPVEENDVERAGQTETLLAACGSYCLFGRFPACYDVPA